MKIGKYLGSNIIGRSTKRFRHFITEETFLTHAKIGYFNVAILIQ